MSSYENRSKVGLFTVAVMAALALSGCEFSDGSTGSDTSSTGPQPSNSSPPGAGSAAPTTPQNGQQPPNAPGNGSGTGAAPCRAADLKAEITDQGQLAPAGIASWLFTATNKSSKPCVLHGYPSFGLKNPTDAVMPDSRTNHTPHPGAPIKFTLEPGSTGYAGVKWQICAEGDLLGGLVLTPPGETHYTSVSVISDRSDADLQKVLRPCGHAVTAGSLQPSNQGVIFTS